MRNRMLILLVALLLAGMILACGGSALVMDQDELDADQTRTVYAVCVQVCERDQMGDCRARCGGE